MARALQAADGYLIVTHKNPDGDTLGSAAALCRGLRMAGKRADVLANAETGWKYANLCQDLQTTETKGKTPVFVDVAAPEMACREAAEAGLVPYAVIDHHPHGWKDHPRALVDPKRAATGELIFALLRELGVSPDREIARALYVAISTDTGCFRFGNTTAETHAVTAELLRQDIGMEEINRALFELRTPAALALQREMLCGMKYYAQGRIALISVSMELRRRLGVTEDDMDDISSLPRQVEGVDIGVTLKELPDESGWRVSLRTTSAADASAIAVSFGGGGHTRAAGCTLSGTLENCTDRVVNACRAYLGL